MVNNKKVHKKVHNMQKIHKQEKLSIGNIKITEICYQHFLKKANQIIAINISEPIWTISKIHGMEWNLI